MKNHSFENRDRVIENQKICDKENRDKSNTRLNEYYKNRKDSDLFFLLTCSQRSRTSKAFKAQNVRKTNKTFDLLGCSHSFFRRWIIHQLDGKMTLENYGSVWQIDHCVAITSFNLLDEKEMKMCFNWINLKPMYVKENIIKVDKIDMRLYLLQEIKGRSFMKLKVEEGQY